MARTRHSLVYVGINNHVIAFDRKSGAEAWRQELPAKHRSSSSFVNVVRDRDGLFATCAGEVFALDPATGEQLWHDQLKGLGTGLITLATDLGGATGPTALAEMTQQQQAAGAAAAAV